MNPKKLCFVIQGFGEKTDFTTGQKFNLDASYQVIKEAVEAANLTCVRADEIQHSGVIDKPMYENLLRADLVIADLSTYNVNAAFELGVRYALRPSATIVVAEAGFRYPFDVGHIAIRNYKHLGEDIGAKEARRFRDDLKEAIVKIVGDGNTDSPVYTFIPALTPPREGRDDPKDPPSASSPPPPPPPSPAPLPPAGKGGSHNLQAPDESAKQLLDSAMAALDAEKFGEARILLAVVHKMRPNDDNVTQKLALATYKSKTPNPEQALRDALAILEELQPRVSNDPETLGLVGAVRKRLWDLTTDPAHLDQSIASYERGFYLKGDYYTGINYAFVLNTRAALLEKRGAVAESIADFMAAKKVRAAVLESTRVASAEEFKSDEQKYWVLATALEAAVGLEAPAEVEALKAKLAAMPAKQWMRDTTNDQIAKLGELMSASPMKHLQRAAP